MATPAVGLAKSWRMQVGVIHALMIRELSTRFGRENIGFLWIMVEPLLFAGLVAIIWRWMKGPEEYGISVAAFVVTGYIPITLFRHSVTRSISIFLANGSLLYHRQIKIFDFIAARFVIELIGGMMAFLFAAVLLYYLGEFPVPDNIGLALGGWFVYAFFVFSLCLVVAPLSEMSEVLERFMPVLTYVMIPFSGLFTMAAWLTPGLRGYYMYSPFVHGMEMLREGLWGPDITSHYDVWYPIAVSMVISLVGLAMCRKVRRTMAVE